MNSLRLIDPMKQIANVSKLLVNNKKCLKANMSNEKLLKETLEARIAERNRLFEENSHLKDEIVRLKVELAEGNVLIEDMDKEFAEIWEQNCLLEEIVKNKNSQLADLDAVEENYEALKDEADWMSEELDRLEKTNEALVAKANADRESHDSLFKQLLRNIEDVLEENHHLKESLLMLDENLAEAKNDFKMVCHRLSLIEKKTDKKCKSKCEENR